MRVKSYITILMLLCFASSLEAADVVKTATFTATGSTAAVKLSLTGAYTHRIMWTGAGTRTTCTVKVEQSIDGSSSWTDLITAQTCTTDGTATVAGWANYARITVTALSGAGNTLYAIYTGNVYASGGTQFVDLSGSAANTTAGLISVKTDQTTHGTTDLVAADWIKVNGFTLLTGNGATGTGSPRVTIANDQTPFAFKLQSGAGTAITSTTLSAKEGLDVNIAGGIAVDGTAGIEPVITKSGPPATNYNTTHASNGTTSVTLIDAVTNYSIVVDAISVVNTNATTGFTVYLCDAACSTSNWIPIPAPTALTAGGGVGGALVGGLNFSTTKSALLAFKCATDCTTTVNVGVTYHLVLRP